MVIVVAILWLRVNGMSQEKHQNNLSDEWQTFQFAVCVYIPSPQRVKIEFSGWKSICILLEITNPLKAHILIIENKLTYTKL